MKNLLPGILCALFLCIDVPNTSAQNLTDSLIAHFPLDGDAMDMVGELVPTDTTGLPTFCADRFGTPNGAACFDGGSFWSYGDTLDMGIRDFSISFWIRVDTVRMLYDIGGGFWNYGALPICKGTTGAGTPVRSGYSFMVRQDTPGVFAFETITGDANDVQFANTAPMSLDQWTHVVFSRCDTFQVMHLNGLLVANTPTAADRDINTDIVFTLGALDRAPTPGQDSEFFEGALDDVRIYIGRCLSEADIDTLTLGVPNRSGPLSPTTLSLFPNPASDRMRITAPNGVDGTLILTDADGRIVREPLHITHFDRQWDFSVANLASGAYFVKLQGAQGEAHGRFIKE